VSPERGYGGVMLRHLALAAGLLTGCAAQKGEPEFEVVWAGWNHTWGLLSHRVAYIRAILEPDETLSMGLVGGDWSTGAVASDSPDYRMRHQRIYGNALTIVHGETDLIVGPDGEATVPVTIDSLEHDEVIVVLRGFELDTSIAQGDDFQTEYDPSLGYTSRGFGFAVGPATDDWDTTSFDVSAKVRWGPQDRSDVNEALQLADTGIKVAWTAIGGPLPAVHSTMTDIVPLVHDPPNSPQRAARWQSEGVSGTGIMGITGFDLGLEDVLVPGQGDYLRSYGVEVELGEDGASPTAVTAEIMTTSFIEVTQTAFSPEIKLAWIPTCGVAVRVESVLSAGNHEIGPVEIPPED
jgi:hypothetical protein